MNRHWRSALALLLWVVATATCHAGGSPPVTAATVSFAGARFDVVTVDLRRARLRMFWHDEAGRPYANFAALAQSLSQQGQRLLAATNAGIFEPGFVPTGLFIADGDTQHPLNLAAGTGNFFLKPGGVFLLGEHGAAIVESSRFVAVSAGVRQATQSGPLLVSGGVLHPAFKADSASKKIRNGIGVVTPERVVLVVSDDPVNFWTFAQLFRQRLRCGDALYLDGTISGLYAPPLSRQDPDKGPFAGMVGISTPVRRAPSP